MGRVVSVMSTLKAVFLDRDGVLNAHLQGRYVETPDQLVILPGVARAVRQFNDRGVLTIVISNQQGVALNIMTEAALNVVNTAMKEQLAHSAGARLDAVYYCPHAKDADCTCRKPKPGMIFAALERFHLNASDTIFVGDSHTDLQAAKAANVGVKCLVLSGATQFVDWTKFAVKPDHVFGDLAQVADWVLEERN